MLPSGPTSIFSICTLRIQHNTYIISQKQHIILQLGSLFGL
uniref:Uncharacterized protein n=1 Tax=Anguilla anguilla TaxID=7936 RepID=A0A0E9WDQ8_ANGAN